MNEGCNERTTNSIERDDFVSKKAVQEIGSAAISALI
jgi:hypothetical protein